MNASPFPQPMGTGMYNGYGGTSGYGGYGTMGTMGMGYGMQPGMGTMYGTQQYNTMYGQNMAMMGQQQMYYRRTGCCDPPGTHAAYGSYPMNNGYYRRGCTETVCDPCGYNDPMYANQYYGQPGMGGYSAYGANHHRRSGCC